MDYFELQDYLDKLKPDSNLSAAFINAKVELILKTKDESKIDYLRKWPSDAFKYGITEILKNKKFYLALHNVEIKFDVESEKCKKFLKETYDIDDVLRMTKKSTESDIRKLESVEIRGNAHSMLQLPRTWTQSRILQKRICMRCSQKNDHTYKSCPIKDPTNFKCINCHGNHAACSKSCPKIIEACNKLRDKQSGSSNDKKQEFKKIESSFNKDTRLGHHKSKAPPTINILKFIIELFRNFRSLSASLHQDPQPLLQLINYNLDSSLSFEIEQMLFAKSDDQDPNMNNTMEDENEQILHLNCQSIQSDSKKIQIFDLINQTNCDVLSLNEIFLKKDNNLNFNGYLTLRSDRIEKKGGGSALCIKKSIKGSPIKKDNFPETVGYKINLKHGNELALISHYSSPSTELNEKLFEYATNNFKFFIIVSDFNAWNSNWFCPKSNKKRNFLLSTIEKLDLFILNNETPTYKRILPASISDHLPISASFKNISTDPKIFETIKWQKFREVLRSKPPLNYPLLCPKSIDTSVQNLTNDIQEALKIATDRYEIKNFKNNKLTVPFHILKLIKFKRKIRRLVQKHNNPAHKKLFNYLERNLKLELSRHKNHILEDKLTYLKEFNQSESKHWQALLSINKENNSNKKFINLRNDNHSTSDPAEIRELFACNLDNIFTDSLTSVRQGSSIFPIGSYMHITRDGFNRNQLTVAIVFDLEKAFDKTSHNGIIAKLKEHNLHRIFLRWIEDFLTNRSFRVSYNGQTLKDKSIKCGVPQGSCLSPTIFILFFSDIANSILPDVKIALFADDLCIWVSRTSRREIQIILQKAVNRIIEYCKKWGFKINEKKTCYTTFTKAGLRKKYEKRYGMKIKIGNSHIPLDPNPTFLGIKLDPKIN
ncbi:RNA-directed DNA polymerase from mobile element jockey-like [Brachionus plicatilis]|uniref:RNA-directed DNA polymerase from mobile element jockey-like n=1 Tax=Brachionus plicatilis TaxID=10195 RepID=A0A3M7QXD8_BRAPC|nr:RNA-directed DNA polymerase from mobile element jockey-like [Brachionus plicatilis]